MIFPFANAPGQVGQQHHPSGSLRMEGDREGDQGNAGEKTCPASSRNGLKQRWIEKSGRQHRLVKKKIFAMVGMCLIILYCANDVHCQGLCKANNF
ncbi:hypothetical protein B5X24_HaOG213630 [Helicoverpa armigera]|nr:hypothetical protein B5X24_HaOG213630 [Helicoverpa armigera]